MEGASSSSAFIFSFSFMNGIQRQFLDVDTANDARFPLLLFERINIAVELGMTGVFACDLIQLFCYVIRNDLDLTAEFEISPCIVGVHDEQGHPWVAEHVPTLLTFPCRIDTNILTVIITPHQTRLRLTIGHHRCKYAMNGAHNK